jgi:hypothetical protein
VEDGVVAHGHFAQPLLADAHRRVPRARTHDYEARTHDVVLPQHSNDAAKIHARGKGRAIKLKLPLPPHLQRCAAS